MAGSVNKVMLIGNVGKDPESRTFQNGGKSVSFSLATSESWKDKNTGERQERTQWHNIVIMNEQIGGIAERYVKKGSKIFIEGQLETRKWQDKDGHDKYTTEVVIRPYRGELTLLDSKGAGEGGYASGGGGSNSGFNDNGGNYGGGGGNNYSSNRSSQPAVKIDELEDEIPF